MTTMCRHPWVGLDISPQGEFKPCCKYLENIADNLSDYVASPKLKELRAEFEQGKQPSGCQRCWDDESAGMPSKRQLDYQYIFGSTEPSIDTLKVLSLSFGNSCNLACRICDSYSSSTWIVERKRLQAQTPQIKIYEHKRFYQDPMFINQIKDAVHDVIHVEFPGGEPFMAGTSEHLDFLDYLIGCGADNISLHYMTNTTIYPSEEFWSRWGQFKKVDIQLSIDGTNDHFEYNRWPAKWEDSKNNIDRYIAQKVTTPNLQLSVGHTVSIFTVYYLPEFIIWCLQNQLGKPYLGLLADPKMYNIKCLPAEIKHKIEEKIGSFNLKGIVSYMNSEDLSSEWDNGVNSIKILDSHRNQNFNTTFKEFYQLVEETQCQI